MADRGRHEIIEIAVKAFELSQTLREKWLTADYAAKRRILEIVFLNCVLDDVTLVPTMRKPFDVLAEGLVSEISRGDWHSFEPYAPLVEEYTDVFLDAIEPHLQAIVRLTHKSAASTGRYMVDDGLSPA